jgi:hypothetical protein
MNWAKQTLKSIIIVVAVGIRTEMEYGRNASISMGV